MLETINVGILRPSKASLTGLPDSVAGGEDDVLTEYFDRLFDRTSEMSRLFREASENSGIHIGSITEYQMFGDNSGKVRLMSAKSARHAHQNEILASLDPTPSQMAFTTTLLRHPVQRAVVARTGLDMFDRQAAIVGTQKIRSLGSLVKQGLQRVFALHLPINDDAAAEAFQQNVEIVGRSLRYPDLPSIPYTADPDTFLIEPPAALYEDRCSLIRD